MVEELAVHVHVEDEFQALIGDQPTVIKSRGMCKDRFNRRYWGKVSKYTHHNSNTFLQTL